MSINNFDHISREVYDGAKANSPRANQAKDISFNIMAAPEMETRDDGQTVLTAAMIGNN